MNRLLGIILLVFLPYIRGQPNQNGGDPSKVIIGIPQTVGLSNQGRVLVLPSSGSSSVVRWAGDPRGQVRVDTSATLLKPQIGNPVRALGLGTRGFRDRFALPPSTTWTEKQNPPQTQPDITRGKIPSSWLSGNSNNDQQNQAGADAVEGGRNSAVEIGGSTGQNPPQQSEGGNQQPQSTAQQQPSEQQGPTAGAGQQPFTQNNNGNQPSLQITAQQPQQQQQEQPQPQPSKPSTDWRSSLQWRNTAQKPSTGTQAINIPSPSQKANVPNRGVNGDQQIISRTGSVTQTEYRGPSNSNTVSDSIFFNPSQRTNAAGQESNPTEPAPNQPTPNQPSVPVNQPGNRQPQPVGIVRTRPEFNPAASVFVPSSNPNPVPQRSSQNNNNNAPKIPQTASQPSNNNPNPSVDSSVSTQNQNAAGGQIRYIGNLNVGPLSRPPVRRPAGANNLSPPQPTQNVQLGPSSQNRNNVPSPVLETNQPQPTQSNTQGGRRNGLPVVVSQGWRPASAQSNQLLTQGAVITGTNQRSQIQSQQPSNTRNSPTSQLNPSPQQPVLNGRNTNPAFQNQQRTAEAQNQQGANMFRSQGSSAVSPTNRNQNTNQQAVNRLSPVPPVNTQRSDANQNSQTQGSRNLFALPPEFFASFPAGMDGQMILNRLANQIAQGNLNGLLGIDAQPSSNGRINSAGVSQQQRGNQPPVNNPRVQPNMQPTNMNSPQIPVNSFRPSNNQGQGAQVPRTNQGDGLQTNTRQQQTNVNNNINGVNRPNNLPTSGGSPPMLPQRPPVRQTGLPQNTQRSQTFPNSVQGRGSLPNNPNGPLLGRSWTVSGTGNENQQPGLNGMLLPPMQPVPAVTVTTPEPTEAPEVEAPEPTPGPTPSVWERLGITPPNRPVPGMPINRQTGSSNQQAPPVPNNGARIQRPNFLSSLWPNRFPQVLNRNANVAPDASSPNRNAGPQQAGPNPTNQQQNGGNPGGIQRAWSPPSQSGNNQQQPNQRTQSNTNPNQPNINNNQKPQEQPTQAPTEQPADINRNRPNTLQQGAQMPRILNMGANPNGQGQAQTNPFLIGNPQLWPLLNLQRQNQQLQNLQRQSQQSQNSQTTNQQGQTQQERNQQGQNQAGQNLQRTNNADQNQQGRSQTGQNQQGQTLPAQNQQGSNQAGNNLLGQTQNGNNNPINPLMFPGMVPNGGTANSINPLLQQGNIPGMPNGALGMQNLALQRRFLDRACGPSKILQQNYQRQYMQYMAAQQQRRQAQMAMFQGAPGGQGQSANPMQGNPFMAASGNQIPSANTMPGNSAMPGANMMPGNSAMPGANMMPGVNMMNFGAIPLTAPESPEINYQCMAAESCGTTPQEQSQAMHRTPQSAQDCQTRTTGLLCCLG